MRYKLIKFKNDTYGCLDDHFCNFVCSSNYRVELNNAEGLIAYSGQMDERTARNLVEQKNLQDESIQYEVVENE